MFTNEQALEIIKQHDECYVVWATDKNTIVAVHPIPPDAGAKGLFTALSAMKTDYQGPTKGRFLSSARTTLQTLIDESHETERIATRVKIFNSWTRCTIDELIEILLRADFHDPMDASHGSSHIAKRLYKIHGPNLTGRHVEQLEKFAASKDVHPEQRGAQKAVRCYLCVLRNDPAGLKTFWRERHSPDRDGSWWTPFTDAAGDLSIDDQEIIDQLIGVVERPYMFGPRYEAMVTLGKIGPPAGPRSVRVITDAIYDSSESVTAVRNRVVERIASRIEDWTRCPSCFHGYVDGTAYQIPSVQVCQNCLGLGHVPL